MDRRIVELEELEKEGDDNESDEFVDGLWKEVGDEYVKVKSNISGHEELISQIRIMCGFIIETRSNLPNAVKIINEAREALDKAEEAEKLIEKRVSEWQKDNRKWIRGKKKKKQEQSNKTPHTEGATGGRWLETFAKQLQPEGTLKNDGDLTKMKTFKASMFTWTDYVRREGFKIDNKLYFDLLANQCDPSMRLKLEAISGVRELGERKLWEIIEGIYQDSNPRFIRRLKVYELEMKKGEQASDFATRLKLDYEESEMAKATIWSHFQYKIISSINTSGSDNRDLKTKLIQEVGKNPDPDEAGLESFLKVIRDHEAMVKAREFKEDSGGNMNRVKPEGEQTGAQNPHRVCGKVHGRGECKYQCRQCKKPHREEDCYELHPEKRPKS